MNILTKMVQNLNIDFVMLNVNKNYFVSIYITDLNSFEMISEVNSQMNKTGRSLNME